MSSFRRAVLRTLAAAASALALTAAVSRPATTPS